MVHGLVAWGELPIARPTVSPVSVLMGSTAIERQQAKEDLMTIEEMEKQRREIYEIAEAVAPGWERWRARIEDVTAPVRGWMIQELAPRPGDTVLELAGGAGDTGFEAAAIVGERGRLISTDFSPAMVEVAGRRGAELGLAHVDYRVMDAERIELEADSVDGVLCRFGYMLMADPAAAFAETRRVLRAGGRVALAVWGAPERNPWATVGFGLLIERGHLPPPEPGAPSPFALASEAHTRALLEGAGFSAVRTEEIPVRFTFRDIDDYTTFATDTGGPAALVLRGLPDDERELLKTHLAAAFTPFGADAGYELPGVALCAVAD
jgi:ubiquinone/menaquinone biosynthesis C-methylase UbiE